VYALAFSPDGNGWLPAALMAKADSGMCVLPARLQPRSSCPAMRV